MANLLRIRGLWTGFTGGPGYTNWYFDYTSGDPLTVGVDAGSMSDFFTALKSDLAPGITITVPGEAAVIDSATGQQVDVVTFDGPADVVSGGVGPYSAASGGMVSWNTGGVVGGRVVKGRTFIVPTANSAYEDDGTLNSTFRTKLQDAANAVIAAGGDPFVVYSRPTATRPAGTFSPVTSASVPDMAAVLRSRRD